VDTHGAAARGSVRRRTDSHASPAKSSVPAARRLHRNPGEAPAHQPTSNKENFMNLHLSIGPLVSLIAGILILVMPRLLNTIVAVYLIIIGLLGLFGR
jgi:hypothetical protein